MNLVIERYDTEVHGVVVGAPVYDEIYRVPILNFASEGDARLFNRTLERHHLSPYVMRQIDMWAKNYERDRKKLVYDWDYVMARNDTIEFIKLKRKEYKYE